MFIVVNRPYFVPHTISYYVYKFSTVALVTKHRVTQRVTRSGIERWLLLETWAWAACERWVLKEQKHRRQYSTQKSSINFAAKLRAAFAYSADGELLCDDKFLVGAVIFHSTAKWLTVNYLPEWKMWVT